GVLAERCNPARPALQRPARARWPDGLDGGALPAGAGAALLPPDADRSDDRPDPAVPTGDEPAGDFASRANEGGLPGAERSDGPLRKHLAARTGCRPRLSRGAIAGGADR